MSDRRCRWCGRFVVVTQQPTTRTVYGYRYDAPAWRTFTQLLCPPCSVAWSTDSPWNRAPDAEQ